MRKLPLVALSLCIASLGGVSLWSAKAIEVKADATPTYSSSVPTQNITLRDNSDEEIKTYYASLNGLSDEELSGTNLLKNLKPILQDFTYYSYDAVWKIYEITDREWNLSPAANDTYSTTNFDSEDNQYTKYVYGNSAKGTQNYNPGNDPYVHTLYRNRDENGITVTDARIHEWDEHSGSNNATNREHVWCQSRGFKADTGARGPAGTDIHHLISGDAYVNMTTHNNTPYGFVDRGRITIDSSNTYAWLSGNITGYPYVSHVGDESAKVFEPQDSDKGDIARAIFYMAACYNNYSGNETITQYNPNLIVADYATSDGDHEDSSAEHPVAMGTLSDLLSWHKMDPVDEYEIHRNNLIFNNYQFNRNPFIDYPEWADYIWGTTTYDADAHQTLTYDSTSTGHVDFSKDVINGYRPDEPEPEPEVETWVKATDIRLGDEVVLANIENETKALLSISTTSTKYGIGTNIDVVEDAFSYETEVMPLLVCNGSQAGTLALKTPENKYLTWTSGNSLNVAASISDNSSWNISISNGKASVINVADNTRKLRWNNSSPRFACYTDGQKDVCFYKTASCAAANSWSDSFLNTWSAGCDPNGVSSTLQWNEAKAAYDALSSFARTKISEKEADSTTIGLAVERYDYIVGKYHLDDFLHRVALNSLMFDTVSVEERPNVTWIVVSFAASVALCVPGLCFALMGRKKKHE